MIQKYDAPKIPNRIKNQRLFKYRSSQNDALSSVRKNISHKRLASQSRNASFSPKNVFMMREKVIKSRNGNTPNLFKFTHLSSSARNRKLLQFSSSSTSIDPIPENSSGGCVFIQSPYSAIRISMSSFVECSSFYGGGIYINASEVTFVDVTASRNNAQQGSGVFSVANSNNFESCIFKNNTAVSASSKSRYSYAPSSFSHGFFEKFPDADAALGAGLFVTALQQLQNCTFTDNLVIAGISEGLGWNSVTKVVTGAHALGSGVFAILVLDNAKIFQNEWIRNKQLRGGPCVAGGSFFVGVIGNLAVLERLTFKYCETISIANSQMDQSCNVHSSCLGISVALGYGITFLSAAAPISVKLNFITSQNSLVRSVGLSVGGILTSLGLFMNASISNTAVESAVFECFGVSCRLRGASIYLNKASAINISTVTVSSLSLSCVGPSCKIFGGLIDILVADYVFISGINAKSVTAHTLGRSSSIRGAILNFGSVTSSRCFDVTFNEIKVSCAGLSCIVGGGVVNVDVCKETLFSSLTFGFVFASCSGSECLVYGGHLFLVDALRVHVVKFHSHDASILAERQMLGGIFVVQFGVDLYLSNVLLQNITTTCGHSACDMRGSLLHFDTSTRLTLSNIVVSSSYSKLSVSSCSHGGQVTCYVTFFFFRIAIETSIDAIHVFDSNIACIGDHCSVSGILNAINCQYCKLSTINVSNMSCSVSGQNSRAYGCVISLTRSTFSRISNIIVKNASVDVFGSFIGGGMIAFENFFGSYLDNATFEHVSVVCSKPKCTSQVGSSTPYECICRLNGGLIWFSKITSSFVQNITTLILKSQCVGEFCSNLGGVLQIDAFLQSKVSNLDLSMVQASSSGYSSSTSGAGIFISLSNSSSVQFLRVYSSSCISFGVFSSAMGVGIAILAGNVLISNVRLVNLWASCYGPQCNSLGGGISIVSSLSKFARNPEYKDLSASSNVSLSHAFCQSLQASCFGTSCSASGAAISAKRSFRSTDTLGLIKAQLTNETPDIVRFELSDSQFFNCSLVSDYINSSLTGGTLSFAPAIATISACSIHHSKLQSSNLSAFIAGGAIFVSGSESTVDFHNIHMINNSVPSPGLGGALYIGAGCLVRVTRCVVSNNSASRGAGIHVEASFLELHQSSVNYNRAGDRGAAIFCASIDRRCNGNNLSCVGGSSSVSVVSSSFRDNVAEFADAVGSSLFVAGAVSLNIDDSTSISIKQDSTKASGTKRDQTDGTMLRITPVTSSSVAVISNEPTAEVLSGTSCFPLCIGVPQYDSFVVSRGMVTSCSPCPQDKYSFKTSNITTDTEEQFCISCPFGASCRGANDVTANPGYWGWKSSDTVIHSPFVRLPVGFGCNKKCDSISSCSGNRNDVLCGGCQSNFSFAFFDKSCVPESQCESWKFWPLCAGAFLYMFLFSMYLMYSNEVAARLLLTLNISNATADANIHVELDASENLVTFSRSMNSSDTSIQQRFNSILDAPVPYNDNQRAAESPFNQYSIEHSDEPRLQSRFNRRSRKTKQENGLQADSNEIEDSERAKPKNVHESPFPVLMWFYQLAGLLLSMSSPLEYLDGSSILFSVLSFIFSTEPPTDSASVIGNSGSSDAKFAFCVDKDTTPVTIFGANIVFYCFWTLITIVVSHPYIWGVLRIVPYKILAKVSKPEDRNTKTFSDHPFPERKYHFPLSHIPSIVECRGRLILDFAITVYNAVLVLLVQATSCVDLQGLNDSAGTFRWYYDGRVACYSNTGKLDGRWQIAAACFVAVFILLPLLLFLYMRKSVSIPQQNLNWFDSTAVPHYQAMFRVGARHWMVIMFYERVIVLLVCNYVRLATTPFWGGFTAMVIMVGVFSLDVTFKPFKCKCIQYLSTSCACMLTVLCAVILRAQALQSAARSSNFDPIHPQNEKESGLMDELQGTIGIVIIVLVLPLIFAADILIGFKGLQRLVNFFLRIKTVIAASDPLTSIDGPENASTEPPKIVEKTGHETDASCHGVLSTSIPLPPPRRLRPTPLQSSAAPVQSVDMLSWVQKSVARRESPSHVNNFSPQSSSKLLFERDITRSSHQSYDSSSEFDSCTPNVSRRPLRDKRTFQSIVVDHGPSSKVAARSGIIDAFQSTLDLEAGMNEDLKPQVAPPLFERPSRPLSRASSVHSDVDEMISNISTPDVSSSGEDISI